MTSYFRNCALNVLKQVTFISEHYISVVVYLTDLFSSLDGVLVLFVFFKITTLLIVINKFANKIFFNVFDWFLLSRDSFQFATLGFGLHLKKFVKFKFIVLFVHNLQFYGNFQISLIVGGYSNAL